MRVVVLALALAGGLIGQDRAAELVRELGSFPGVMAQTPSTGQWPPEELRRQEVYRELRAMGARALPALAAGLADDDVRVRRGAALYLAVAGSSWGGLAPAPLEIAETLPALRRATADADGRVRATAAQTIGDIGANAVAAVPDLVRMLESSDEGDRISGCIGLRGIGPGAAAALPALRNASEDSSDYVRRFAAHAVAVQEGRDGRD